MGIIIQLASYVALGLNGTKLACVLLLVLACFLAFSIVHHHKSPLQLPPGPYPLPVIGNIHQVPILQPWKVYGNWNGKYGPVVNLKYGSLRVIILGSNQIVSDLLEKRGSIYSSRPRAIFANEHMSKNLNAGLLPYGGRWRIQRQLHNALLNPRMVQMWLGLLDSESRQLLNNLLHTSDFCREIHRYSISSFFALAYGRQLRHSNEYEIRELLELSRSKLHATNDIRNLIVDAFPCLERLPPILAPWKRQGSRLYKRTDTLFRKFAAEATSTESWNMVKEASTIATTQSLSEVELVHGIGNLMEVAHDTTSAVLEVAIMACVLHPTSVSCLQNELDGVVGPNRLPGFDDIPNLRYLQAFTNEVLRWRPILPCGIPRENTADDTYMGYYIPKGWMILPNHWALSMDNEVFHNPDEFKPERWLEDPSLPLCAFGFGRRECPGRNLARHSLMIAISRLVWSYNFSHAYENGRRVEIDPSQMASATLSSPAPFKARISVRSNDHLMVIKSSMPDFTSLDQLAVGDR
ncbi:cytochrome P450 [Aspergillus tamarii]|uniref:Cytochrome P450 n=1 Tax=Aspergillus tamarii TaxID=41984 RepID=A0A5N6V9C4_ASPTM|nr:cytochrome P450 [Aspergillus tamarii]